MNMKKFLASACAGAMALSLAVPAFASNVSNPNKTDFTGAIADNTTGTVSVSLRANAATKLYVNPYGVSYDLPYGEVKTAGADFDVDKDLVIAQGTSAAGFFSDVAVIENKSTSALTVGYTLTTTEKGAVKVVAAAPGSTPTANTLYGSFEITSATMSTGTAEVTKADGTTKEEKTGVTIITPDWSATAKKSMPIPAGGGTAGTAGTATSSTPAQNYTLAAATSTTDPMTQAVTITPAYAAYRLTGTAVSGEASGATIPWAQADVANVTVAFTFTPAP